MYDVLVVGGGPAGSFVARGMAEKGFSVLIVEEHREIGRPLQCSGLVSPRVLDMAGSSRRVVKKKLRSAIVYSGSEELLIESGDVKAIAIDRAMFDRELASSAIRAGADIMLGARVVSFEKDGRGMITTLSSSGEKVKVRSRFVVGADGASSLVARRFDMDWPREILGAFQAQSPEEVDEVRIWPEPESSFFTWQIPLDEGSLIGTASSGNPSAQDILKKRFPELERHSLSIYGGSIPIGYSRNIVGAGVALVGDSAVQVKPLSGGGLYPGLSAAQMLVDALSESFDKDKECLPLLSAYQRAWSSSVGKEIKNGMYIRKIYARLSGKDMEKIIHELNNENSRRIIGEIGDIDHPSLLARPLVKSSPKLLVFARHLLGLLV